MVNEKNDPAYAKYDMVDHRYEAPSITVVTGEILNNPAYNPLGQLSYPEAKAIAERERLEEYQKHRVATVMLACLFPGADFVYGMAARQLVIRYMNDLEKLAADRAEVKKRQADKAAKMLAEREMCVIC